MEQQDSRIPLYHVVQEHIRSQILSGRLKPGDKIPTEKELRDAFNVSRMTISTAMMHLTKENLIQRIPGKGSFVASRDERADMADPNSSEAGFARDLQPVQVRQVRQQPEPENRARNIGLIMTNIDSVFAMRIVNNIHQVIEQNGCNLTIMLTDNVKKKEVAMIKSLLDQQFDGLIIYPTDDDRYNDSILSLKLQRYPFVLIDRYLPGVDTHYVCSDNALGARMAVSHLWELGHRDIAVCSSIDFPTITIRDRIDGYIQELTSRGAMINPSLILKDIDTRSSQTDENHPLYRYMKVRSATAYLALHPHIALLLYQFAESIGLRVPEDISIVSFDNPTILQDQFSFFTFIDQQESTMGRQAAELAIQLTAPLYRRETEEKNEELAYEKIVLQPVLKINQSTAAPFAGS